jgi:hypothetical protein
MLFYLSRKGGWEDIFFPPNRNDVPPAPHCNCEAQQLVSRRVWVRTTVSLLVITEDRQVRDSHTATMWAAGDEPAFTDTIKLGNIHGITHKNLV